MKTIITLLLIVTSFNVSALDLRLKLGFSHTLNAATDDMVGNIDGRQVTVGNVAIELHAADNLIVYCKHMSRINIYDYGSNQCGLDAVFRLRKWW